jgi:transcriptional regulator with XRE-family HTH domain
MTHRWEDLKKATFTKAQVAAIDARVKQTLARMPLADVRKAIGRTQVDMAATLGIGQAAISKLEHATDMYLSTLRRHVEALGGELTLMVSFPDGQAFTLDAVEASADDSRRTAKQAKSKTAVAQQRRRKATRRPARQTKRPS